MYFGFSPTAGTILAIILIAWLIGSGIKSAGKKLPKIDTTETMTLKEMKEALGPMTWDEHLLGILMLFVFVGYFVWLAYNT